MTASSDNESPEERQQRLAAESQSRLAAMVDAAMPGLTPLHQLYVQLKEAGFTRTDSLWICSYILSNGSGKP